MKKTNLLFTATVLFGVLVSGCSKTPAGNTDLFIAASVTYSGGYGSAAVSLEDMRNSLPVTGATVSLNGQDLPYNSSSQDYSSATLSGITAGAPITLSIASSMGNVLASGNMPAASGQANVPIPGYFSLSSMILKTP